MSFIRDLAYWASATAENDDANLQDALNFLRDAMRDTDNPEQAMMLVHTRINSMFDPSFTSPMSNEIEFRTYIERAWMHYDRVNGTDYAPRFKLSSATHACTSEQLQLTKKQSQRRLWFSFLFWCITFILSYKIGKITNGVGFFVIIILSCIFWKKMNKKSQ